MSIATNFTPPTRFPNLPKHNHSLLASPSSLTLRHRSTSSSSLSFSPNHALNRPVLAFSGGDGINGGGNGRDSSGGGGDNSHSGGGGGGGGGGRGGGDGNKGEAILALAEIGRSLDSLPKDLAAAVEAGRIPGSVVLKYFELEKSAVFRWLLQFGGFMERLLADDLFLAKVGMECGVGIFTKTAAEYERRRENFFNELEIVFADEVMAIIADFMLVWLPAPTVSLRPPIALNAGRITKFFYSCPDNAFQVALGGASFSLFQRKGAIVRNGSKLFAVGTTSSLELFASNGIFVNKSVARRGMRVISGCKADRGSFVIVESQNRSAASSRHGVVSMVEGRKESRAMRGRPLLIRRESYTRGTEIKCGLSLSCGHVSGGCKRVQVAAVWFSFLIVFQCGSTAI